MYHKFTEEFKSCNKRTTQFEAMWQKHNSKQCSLMFILTRWAFRLFSAWFMKHLSKIKLQTKWHFMANKTQVMQHVFRCSKFLCIV